MTRFTITCACGRTNLKFRSLAGYGADIISRLYCPKCSSDAPIEAFLVEVKGSGRHDGVYGMVWNMGAAEFYRQGNKHHDIEFFDLFGKKKLIFDFISPAGATKITYTVLGYRAPSEKD